MTTDAHERRRREEMQQGARVVQRYMEEHAEEIAHDAIRREFDPDYTNPSKPPLGYLSWEDFRKREAVHYLPNNRDGTPK